METVFTKDQLQDPRLAEADAILRRCVHCGFCTATCPTYLVLGDERDSPRGRIYLIKSMLEGEASPRQVRTHMDRCLSCYACMTTCPSGVDYMHLSDFARAKIEKSVMRMPKDRLTRKLLRFVLPYPGRFRLALLFSSAAKPFRKLFKSLGFPEIEAMLRMAPTKPMARGTYASPQTVKTKSARRGRVVLMSGCAQRVLRPQINDASVRFLNHLGYDVILPQNEGCCGALTLHMGKENEAKAFARRNIDAWVALREEGPIDAIIMNASGCGTTVKDYGHLFAQDAAYADKAKYISAITKDITEFAASVPMDAPPGWTDIRVAYHSACSMQHGQQIQEAPRKLLKNAGFTVAEIPEGHICCGSAGTYNIMQATIADELRQRKLDNIAGVKADCAATGNIGCITQLGSGKTPMVHTVELLDWAYGGPCPEEIQHLRNRVRTMSNEPRSRSAEVVRA